MKIFAKVILVAVAGASLGGCATVINGTSQDYWIESDPSGAIVRLTGGMTCETPCKLNLKRGRDFRADFTLEGYRSAYVLVQSRTGGAAAGNILLGGLIGGVVDGTNGATNHLSPNPLVIRLVPNGSDAKEALIDQDGKEDTTVEAHNAKVRDDVAKTIGADAAGITPATPAAAPAAPPAAPVAQQTEAAAVPAVS
ncbi:PEGA domain-containing protein [Novosphingobium sp.]|uniref:PEGA domain-containing protein n=1 Tax=Novosphingobium sp. TaxID=1874826 RepID=UPI0035B40967